MKKTINQKCEKALLNIVIKNGGTYFDEENDYMYFLSQCRICKHQFALRTHNNPSFDGPRELEFPDVCDYCLQDGDNFHLLADN